MSDYFAFRTELSDLAKAASAVPALRGHVVALVQNGIERNVPSAAWGRLTAEQQIAAYKDAQLLTGWVEGGAITTSRELSAKLTALQNSILHPPHPTTSHSLAHCELSLRQQNNYGQTHAGRGRAYA